MESIESRSARFRDSRDPTGITGLGWNVTHSCTDDPDLNNHCTLRVYGHGCWGYVDVWEDGTVESGGNFDAVRKLKLVVDQTIGSIKALVSHPLATSLVS